MMPELFAAKPEPEPAAATNSRSRVDDAALAEEAPVPVAATSSISPVAKRSQNLAKPPITPTPPVEIQAQAHAGEDRPDRIAEARNDSVTEDRTVNVATVGIPPSAMVPVESESPLEPAPPPTVDRELMPLPCNWTHRDTARLLTRIYRRLGFWRRNTPPDHPLRLGIEKVVADFQPVADAHLVGGNFAAYYKTLLDYTSRLDDCVRDHFERKQR